MARRRGPSDEDRKLWGQVARSVTPLSPRQRNQALAAADAGSPGAGERKTAAAPTAPSARIDGFTPTPFRIGQATHGRSGLALSSSPSPAERLAQSPVRMDARAHRRMTQGKLSPEARLDLHGMTLSAAHPQLLQFVLSCHGAGLRLVLVITGKGRGDHGPLPTRPGALRHQVPYWLHSPPLSAVVQHVSAAHFRHGGEGAYYVYLRRGG